MWDKPKKIRRSHCQSGRERELSTRSRLTVSAQSTRGEKERLPILQAISKTGRGRRDKHDQSKAKEAYKTVSEQQDEPVR
eukprot:118695-Hanusia_phi.AAC.8